MQRIFEFKDDDEGYLKWLEEHPKGFVLNTPGGDKFDPNKARLKCHRATCNELRKGKNNTTRWYVKFCFLSKVDFEKWMNKTHPEIALEDCYCKHCKAGDDNGSKREQKQQENKTLTEKNAANKRKNSRTLKNIELVHRNAEKQKVTYLLASEVVNDLANVTRTLQEKFKITQKQLSKADIVEVALQLIIQDFYTGEEKSWLMDSLKTYLNPPESG